MLISKLSIQAPQGILLASMIRKMKKRDAFESRVHTAYAHVKSLKENFHIYTEESTRVLEAYKKWLEENNMEPLMDLKQYT